MNEDLGHTDQAAEILACCLDQEMPGDARQQVIKRLSFLHKRRGEMPQALSLWWQAAADREIYAHEELAKHFEHTEKNYTEALKWTESALAILSQPGASFADKLQWQDALEHRRARLKGKIEREAE